MYFAECPRKTLGKDFFAECPPGWHSAKMCKVIFAECQMVDTRQRILYRVPPIWHSAKFILKIKKNFAECQITGTRQRRRIYSPAAFFLLISLLCLLSIAPSRLPAPAAARLPRARPAAAARSSGGSNELGPPLPGRLRYSLRPAVYAQPPSGHPRVHHRRRPRPRIGIIFFLDQSLYYYSTINCISMMFEILHMHYVIRLYL